MKKTILFLSVLLTMVSCHHLKPVDGSGMEREDVDSTLVEQDSLAVADGVEVASDEMFSEDYLYGWIVRVYDKVNEVWARQEVHQEELDTAFFAKSYLDLKAQVKKAEEGKDFDHLFFIEYMPFSQGLRVPIRLNTVKVNLLTGNIAEIDFDISDPDGNEVKMWWHLTFENGQWRIDDFNNDPEDSETYVDRMEDYLQGNQ
ncbi:MAG: hypothetical protein IJP82_06505 [Bacteroidaceae bacterium]|nr:hypothetical protein [Bacteroidaceae bacterium]